MLRGLTFVVGLYMMSACMLIIGTINLCTQAKWYFWGHPAMMVIQDPSKKLSDHPISGVYASVKYLEKSGETLVPKKPLSKAMAERLVNGEQIPVIFQKDNLEYVLYSSDELESPWIWLTVGVIVGFVAVYSKKLYRRETKRVLT
ncbi:hypothetical protein [Undibacterium sp. Tian12W]|uniref:hypothetical protein n=1 Tax=Undibacterium sp. Tian12W TaxID=3413054 RepID=UPI003BF0261B